MKVLLASSQSSVLTDGNGPASMMPPVSGLHRALEAEITASSGASAALQFEWLVLPTLAPGEESRGKSPGPSSSSSETGQNPAVGNAGVQCGERSSLCGRSGVGSGGKFPAAYRRVEPQAWVSGRKICRACGAVDTRGVLRLRSEGLTALRDDRLRETRLRLH